MTKFCKDCAFFQQSRQFELDSHNAIRFGSCHNPALADKPKGPDPVTGRVPKPDPEPSAHVRRTLSWLCGKEGRYWEPAFAEPEFEGTTIEHDIHEFTQTRGVKKFLRLIGAK